MEKLTLAKGPPHTCTSPLGFVSPRQNFTSSLALPAHPPPSNSQLPSSNPMPSVTASSRGGREGKAVSELGTQDLQPLLLYCECLYMDRKDGKIKPQTPSNLWFRNPVWGQKSFLLESASLTSSQPPSSQHGTTITPPPLPALKILCLPSSTLTLFSGSSKASCPGVHSGQTSAKCPHLNGRLALLLWRPGSPHLHSSLRLLLQDLFPTAPSCQALTSTQQASQAVIKGLHVLHHFQTQSELQSCKSNWL